MKKIVSIISLILLIGCGGKSGNLLITKESSYDMRSTISHLLTALDKHGYKKVQEINHSTIAKGQNIYLKPTIALVVNNPKISSALLTCNPSLAIEMPIRISIYTELGGKVKVAYTQPEYWSLKHNIKDKNCIGVILQMVRDFDRAIDSIAK